MNKDADLHLSGSHLECAPLVMYESFAARTPFVTTDVGNVSDHKEYLRIVRTPNEMAEAANHLLDNRRGRETMAESAFRLWQEGYVIEEITDQYEQLFNRLHHEHNQTS